MRKHQQTKILDLLLTLEEACGELKKRLSAEDAISLLTDCQALAVQIGAYIESVKGEGTRAVTLLEEYCDLVYKAATGGGTVRKNDVTRMWAQIDKVKDSVKSDMKPDKYEAVFFPYKYAMSDCLESIWLAAMADPKWDVFVCPIPYYDRLPDGKFGLMHFEGELFSKDLPLVDWREYDVEERRPDAIFIHSPYDESNYVTSIHPDFYSKRLREFTDLLVYVPYFVCLDKVEETFCVCPGTLYADRVVVQSEKIRREYITMFRAFEKKNNCTGKFGDPKGKFVALGSPKFDKAISAKRGDFILPGNWGKIIGGKKVVLYNTSIGALLPGNERYLAKLCYVLDSFRERDDVVLWWRPHPLSEASCQSMRPKLLDGYKQIVARYKREGWGIYDDTPDLHRAISWSDMYYGDRSSLVPMYLITGKPVMIQGSRLMGEGEGTAENTVPFANFIFDKSGNGWAYSFYFNGLFKLDFNENRAGFVMKDEQAVFLSPYIALAENDDVITIFPFNSKHLLEYDTKKETLKRIALSGEHSEKNMDIDGYTITAQIKYNETIYAFGHQKGIIVAYHPESGEVEYHTELRDDINKKMRTGKSAGRPLFFRHLGGPKVMLVLYGSGCLVEYDLETREIKQLAYAKELETGEKACFDGKYVWIMDITHDAVRRWDYKNGEIKVFNRFPEGFLANKDHMCFSVFMDCGPYLLMLPAFANMAVILDKSRGAMRKAESFPVPDDTACIAYKYDGWHRERGKARFVAARFNNTVYEFDPETPENIIPHRFAVSDRDYGCYLKNAMSAAAAASLPYNRLMLHDSYIGGSPANFCSKLLPVGDDIAKIQRSAFEKEIDSADGSAGKNISDYLLTAILTQS